jgi:hypothetical protein
LIPEDLILLNLVLEELGYPAGLISSSSSEERRIPSGTGEGAKARTREEGG